MNKFGEASPTTILTLLEETAADHCCSINHSLYDLIQQNIGWVLVSGVMKMERYPIYKEKITIRTWLSNYSTVRGIRENIIYDEKRQECAYHIQKCRYGGIFWKFDEPPICIPELFP